MPDGGKVVVMYCRFTSARDSFPRVRTSQIPKNAARACVLWSKMIFEFLVIAFLLKNCQEHVARDLTRPWHRPGELHHLQS